MCGVCTLFMKTYTLLPPLAALETQSNTTGTINRWNRCGRTVVGVCSALWDGRERGREERCVPRGDSSSKFHTHTTNNATSMKGETR